MGKQAKPKQGNSKSTPREARRTATTIANKKRAAETRAARFMKAALRRVSDDVCVPGTMKRAKPGERRISLQRREAQTARIAKKRETRRRLRSMTPKQRAEARENGKRQFRRD